MSVPLERTFNVRISLPEQRERLLPRNRYDRRHVIRFIQEALTNAAKHSNALNIRLTVKRDGRQAIYEISDHGQGFQPGKRAGGMGLRLMQFNADEAGGEFEIDTSRTGTVVRLRLPAYKTGLICNANIRK
jgi:signal transduction histidine kinase